MSHKVSFIDREDGSVQYISFPTYALASAYARGVKCGVVLPGGEDEAFTVTKLGAKDIEERNRAREAAKERERAEAEEQIHAEEEESPEEPSPTTGFNKLAAIAFGANVCVCGKVCSPGMTNCYTCRRYG